MLIARHLDFPYQPQYASISNIKDRKGKENWRREGVWRAYALV